MHEHTDIRTKRALSLRAKLARLGVGLGLLAIAACAQNAPPTPILDPGKMASIVVGRSSRADVFAALGRPARTEQSAQGETWIYETKASSAGGQGLMNGAAAASGLAGAFVPYVGLIGSGLGLASATAGAVPRAEPDAASVAVSFADNGVVRDCVYSTTASPAGLPGSATSSARIGCQRPAPTLMPRTY